MLTRRGLITGLASLVAAPAIVRISTSMPIKSISSCCDYNFDTGPLIARAHERYNISYLTYASYKRLEDLYLDTYIVVRDAKAGVDISERRIY
jgi:hypothetical protein